MNESSNQQPATGFPEKRLRLVRVQIHPSIRDRMAVFRQISDKEKRRFLSLWRTGIYTEPKNNMKSINDLPNMGYHAHPPYFSIVFASRLVK
jgi:hypothetical protein